MQDPPTSTAAHAVNRPRSAYQALVAEARRVGWPRYFRADLTRHDRQCLRCRDAPPRFGWALREGGTFLLQPAAAQDNHDARVALRQRVAQLGQLHPETRYYWWDGEALTETDSAGWLARLTAVPAETVVCGCTLCHPAGLM